jgi:hypothetical protein
VEQPGYHVVNELDPEGENVAVVPVFPGNDSAPLAWEGEGWG